MFSFMFFNMKVRLYIRHFRLTRLFITRLFYLRLNANAPDDFSSMLISETDRKDNLDSCNTPLSR